MVKVRYSEVATSHEGDQEPAELTPTIEVQYISEAKQICLTVDIEPDRYFAYWVDLETLYKALRTAIERDELHEDNWLKDFDDDD